MPDTLNPVSLLNDIELQQQREELKAAIAECKLFMTEGNLKWICSHPLVANLVMHPIALMAYETQGIVQGYENPLTEDGKAFKPKIFGKKVGVLATLPRNQIQLLDITFQCFASVVLSKDRPASMVIT
jgi:hypothetical protein